MSSFKEKYDVFEKQQVNALQDASQHIKDFVVLLNQLEHRDYLEIDRSVRVPVDWEQDQKLLNLVKRCKEIKEDYKKLDHDKSAVHVVRKRIKRIKQDADKYFGEMSKQGQETFINNLQKLNKLERDVEDYINTLLSDYAQIEIALDKIIMETNVSPKSSSKELAIATLNKSELETCSENCRDHIITLNKYLKDTYNMLQEMHSVMMST